MKRTRFTYYHSDQFTGLFRECNWSRLNESVRLEVCQELENRLAMERGAPPRQVIPREISGRCYGEQQGNYIIINKYLLRDNCFLTFDPATGNLSGRYPVQAAGWQMFDTICHEDEHGAQLDRGSFQSGLSYFSSGTDSVIYRIQKDEARAYAIGNLRTLYAIEEQKQIVGHLEPDMKIYLDDIKSDRYQDALDEAKRIYNDNNIDKTLNQFIEDRENGITRYSPSSSYQHLQNKMQQQISNLYSPHKTDVEYNPQQNHQNSLGFNLRKNVLPVPDMSKLSFDSTDNHITNNESLLTNHLQSLDSMEVASKYDPDENILLPNNQPKGMYSEDEGELIIREEQVDVSHMEDGSELLIDSSLYSPTYETDRSILITAEEQVDVNHMEDGSELLIGSSLYSPTYETDGSELLSAEYQEQETASSCSSQVNNTQSQSMANE